eukprot:8457356-Prorocentrum_lima.AAC.1
MTSSLVGSEMCIRDRFFGIALPSSACVSAAAKVCAAAPVSGAAAVADAVSYTHLTLPTICSV